jgi:hypothetical protein
MHDFLFCSWFKLRATICNSLNCVETLLSVLPMINLNIKEKY